MKKFLLCVFISLFYSISFYAQNELNQIDSLIKVLPNLKENSYKVEALFKLSKLYQKVSYENSENFNKQLFEVSKKINFQKGLGYYHLNNAYLFQTKGNYEKSIEEAKKAETIFTQLNEKSYFLDAIYFHSFSLFFSTKENEAFDLATIHALDTKNTIYFQQLGQLHYFIAYFHFSKDNISRALKHNILALENYRKVKNTLGILKCYYNMTDLYIKTNQFTIAKEYGYKTLKILNSLEVPVKVMQSGNYASLAEIHLHFKEFEIAQAYCDKAIAINKELNQLEYVGIDLIISAEIDYQKGDFNKILPKAKKIIAISKTPYNLIKGYYYMGLYFNSIKEYSNAKIYLEKGLSLVTEENELVHKNIIKELAFTEEKLKNYNRSLTLLKLFYKNELLFLEDEKINKVNELQVRFDTKEKEIEIKDLTIAAQKDKELLIKKENQKNFLITIIVFGLILGLISYFLYTKIKKKNDKLQTKNSIIEQQNKVISKSNATIKKTFSIISHDLRGPFNVLLGYTNYINENFEELNGEELKSYINKVNNAAQNNFNFTQQLLNWSLKQQNGITINKELCNLNEVVEKSIATLQPLAHQKDIAIHKDFLLEDDAKHYLDKDIVFNVLYNVISNAIKYSKDNTSILIKTYADEQFLTIETKDNGIGMTNEQLQKLNQNNDVNDFNFIKNNNEYQGGFGLTYAKELANLYGAQLVFESVLGEGTTVIFKIEVHV
ncbi:ATP-binding protein [Flavobacterium ponti]|uniref:histidine kinase n=1 Tax=Flavobacterium ponti TaxID=665133 RepID=A0ABV9P387_9FLAO